MELGTTQPFASPEEVLAHISETPWSNFTKADYTPEQWHSACLIHTHEGAPTSKSECKLPVKTPDGVLNRHGVYAAAAALAGARGGLKGVSAEQKQKAASALRRYYTQLDEDPPESLAVHSDFRKKPGTPQDVLEHHGVKGMRWGVRKQEETSDGEVSPEVKQRIGRVTRTDRPQVLSPQQTKTGRVSAQPAQEKQGLTRNQKIALTFGVAGAAAAGYYAYNKYGGPKLDLSDRFIQEQGKVGDLNLPAHWDVRGLKHGPLSTQRLGDLAGGEFNAKLVGAEHLVVNTSRGYADILPKVGLTNAGRERHASVITALEEMRAKYPAIRNMNIEVLPMSSAPGDIAKSGAEMCVLSMRAGEARVMYNDLMDLPTAELIEANRDFLPGLGVKNYIANHEMGHLLAAAHGELPPAFDLLKSDASPSIMRTWTNADPVLHRKMFAKHGFTFQELSKLSTYASTEPAEAMAELAGHYFTPEMRSRLTPSQLRRAEAMFNEMGGLT